MEIKTQGFTTKTGNEQEKKAWGENVLITTLGKINIIHQDNPSEEEISERIQEVLREELRGEAFEDDCPLCQEMSKHPYDVVYWDDPCRKCKKESCEDCDIDETAL
jgi:hypothetical protein